MLREYALDPAVLGALRTPELQSLFLRLFDVKEPRRVSGFPSEDDWYERAKVAIQRGTPQNYTAEACLPDVVIRIRRWLMRRRPRAPFDPKREWILNAMEEHRAQPFHRIVAADVRPDPASEAVVPWTDLASLDQAEDSTEREVRRGSEALIEALVPLAQRCLTIVVVDPYGLPSDQSFVEVLRGLAERQLNVMRPDKLKIVCDLTRAKAVPGLGHLKRSATAALSDLAALGVRRSWVFVRRSHGNDWEMHDRFFLTEIGGVQSSAGFGKGRGTTLLTLLSQPVLDRKLREFNSPRLRQLAEVDSVEQGD